jgi:2-phosphoglycerate kinase
MRQMRERRHTIPLPLGDEVPFSKGLMARALVVTGLDPERSYLIAQRADRDLSERGALSLDLDRLGDLAAEIIGDDEAARTVRRLRRLDALARLEEPLLLLVGGATGTGKSTIATEAAHRLGITRVTSTDFIRQTMRAFFSEEFMPSVHYSSFEARLALTRAEEEESGDAAILGFLDQTRNVLVGVHAALERAATEHWSTVLEGVHLVPGMVGTEFPSAFVVQCIVAIEDENLHRSHFWVRDQTTDGLRQLEKYLDALPQIRQIQEYLIERARRYDVPVIVNDSLDRAIGDVLDLVLRRADQLVSAG